LRFWLEAHVSACSEAVRQLAGRPAGTLATVAVIAIALSLPAALQVAFINLQRVVEPWNQSASISLFLKPMTAAPAVTALRTALGDLPGVAAIELIPKAQALKELRENENFGSTLSYLDENPLPDVLIVVPQPEVAANQADLDRVELGRFAEVDQAVLDTAWVRRLLAITAIVRRGTALCALVLAIGVALIISNTIRLNIAQRQDEIAIAKLVGATDGYTRRPFLYSGAWQGLAGGTLACLMVTGGLQLLRPSVGALALAYGTRFELTGLLWQDNALLIAAGGLLGIVGAALSVGRFLRDADRLLEA
jgi:cell division transport system permease protein